MRDLKGYFLGVILSLIAIVGLMFIYTKASAGMAQSNFKTMVDALNTVEQDNTSVESTFNLVNATDGGSYRFPNVNASTRITTFYSEDDPTGNGTPTAGANGKWMFDLTALNTFGIKKPVTTPYATTIVGSQFSFRMPNTTPTTVTGTELAPATNTVVRNDLMVDAPGIVPFVTTTESTLQKQVLLSLFSMKDSMLETFINDNTKKAIGASNLQAGLTTQGLLEAIVGDRGATVDDRNQVANALRWGDATNALDKGGMIAFKQIDPVAVKNTLGDETFSKYGSKYKFFVVKRTVSTAAMQDRLAKVLFGQAYGVNEGDGYTLTSAANKAVIDDVMKGLLNLTPDTDVVIPHYQKDIVYDNDNIGVFMSKARVNRVKQ